MYGTTSARRAKHHSTERSSATSLFKKIMAMLQTLAQPEDHRSLQPYPNHHYSQGPEEAVSVVFASNEFLTVDLLTDCYKSDS